MALTSPVRTVVLGKLATVLAAVPEIKTVRSFAVVPDDISSLVLPAAYIFEVRPEDRGYVNRVAFGTMHLMVQIFVNQTMLDKQNSGFSDTFTLFDILAARLHDIYHGNSGLSKNGLVNVVELAYDRVITGDSVGWLNSTVDVEYRHDRGNAFS